MSLYHTPYEYTQQGRVEAWQREKMQQRYDFQGAIERQGVNVAKRMMRDELTTCAIRESVAGRKEAICL